MSHSHNDDDILLLFAMSLHARFDRSTAILLNLKPFGISSSPPIWEREHEKAMRARLMEETKNLISGYCRKEAKQINTIYCTDILYPIFEFTREECRNFDAKGCWMLKTPDTSDAEDEEDEEDEEEEGGDNSSPEPALTSSMKNETPDRPRPRVKYLNK